MLVIKQFGRLLKDGKDALVKACQIYVKAIDEDIKLKAVFYETYPEISLTAWRRFEAVGRGSLHPDLLVNYTAAARHLTKCSYSVQTKYLEKPFSVLRDDGTVDRVTLNHLTERQAYQVFDGKHVRTKKEQQTFLDSTRKVRSAISKSPKAKPVTPYRVSRGKLVVAKACSFTRDELIEIILRMK